VSQQQTNALLMAQCYYSDICHSVCNSVLERQYVVEMWHVRLLFSALQPGVRGVPHKNDFFPL